MVQCKFLPVPLPVPSLHGRVHIIYLAPTAPPSYAKRYSVANVSTTMSADAADPHPCNALFVERQCQSQSFNQTLRHLVSQVLLTWLCACLRR